MKVWEITQPGVMAIKEISEDILPDTAKVRITMASFTQNDAKVFRGDIKNIKYPITVGRHAVGVISEIDENNAYGLVRGQRVIIDPNLPCNSCLACKSGKKWECEQMKTLGLTANGLLRDFAVIPLSNIYEIPPQISDEDAQFVEHVSLAVRTFNELKAKEGEHIVIIGASILGIIIAQLALYYQLVPIILDTQQNELDIAKSYGIYYSINTTDEDPAVRVKQITGGRYCENVVYLANSNESVRKAFDFAAMGGKVALVGWEQMPDAMEGSVNSIISKQLLVFGISNGYKQMHAAINLLAKKAIEVRSLVSKQIDFNEVETLLEQYSKNPLSYHKVVIKI